MKPYCLHSCFACSHSIMSADGFLFDCKGNFVERIVSVEFVDLENDPEPTEDDNATE